MNTIFYIEKKDTKKQKFMLTHVFALGNRDLKSGNSCKNREIGYFHVINLNIHTVIKISVSAPEF